MENKFETKQNKVINSIYSLLVKTKNQIQAETLNKLLNLISDKKTPTLYSNNINDGLIKELKKSLVLLKKLGLSEDKLKKLDERIKRLENGEDV